MAKQTLSEKVAAMTKRILKVDGTARAGTTPEQIEALEDLRQRLAGEQAAQGARDRAPLEDEEGQVGPEAPPPVDPDLARNTPEGYDLGDGPVEVSTPMRTIPLTVNGRVLTRQVPLRS